MTSSDRRVMETARVMERMRCAAIAREIGLRCANPDGSKRRGSPGAKQSIAQLIEQAILREGAHEEGV